MKALALLIALGSLSAMANDKVAYVVEKLNSQETYVLCEGSNNIPDQMNPGTLRLVSAQDNLNTMIGILRSYESIQFDISSLQMSESEACVLLNKK